MSKTDQNAWRMFRIMGEFVSGFQTLSELPKAIAIFGSARTKPTDPYYLAAEEIAAHAAKRGFPVISGGGPGIMEAANKGANEAHGNSIGLCIRLPHEQSGNRFITTRVDFHYFFVRKVMFLKHTCAVVVMPGGFGTLDELFEVVTLVQTRKITPMPILLYGKAYWRGLLNWVRTTMDEQNHYISPGDIDLLHLVDSVEEANAVLAGVQVTAPTPILDAPMD